MLKRDDFVDISLELGCYYFSLRCGNELSLVRHTEAAITPCNSINTP